MNDEVRKRKAQCPASCFSVGERSFPDKIAHESDRGFQPFGLFAQGRH